MNVADPEGAPASLSPHEVRVSGQQLLRITVMVITAVALLVWVITAML